MKAVIMAGGEGTRLRPLTCNRPKPLVPLCNKPVMEYSIDLLKQHGVFQIVCTLHYLADEIVSYFGDGSDWGVQMMYSVEDEPLGTAGAVKMVEDYLDETFIIISGDALTDFNLSEIIKFHKDNKSLATLTLTRVDNPLEYGVVITGEDGHIRRFLEKPSWGEVFSDTINTGIYIIEPEVFKLMEKNKNYDWSKDIFPQILEANKPIYGFTATGYWCDIGNLQQYRTAHMDIVQEKIKVKVPGNQRGRDIWIGEGTDIHPSAQISGPAIIGKNCRIKEKAQVDEYSVIGDNSIIEEGSVTHRSILWNNVYIGKHTKMTGAIIGQQNTIKDHVNINEGVVLGDKVFIGSGAVVQPQVKVWPDKNIEAGANVNMSLIWGVKWPGALFGVDGISGLANIEITPDYAMKLGAAYGAYLAKGSIATTSRDSHPACRMINRAIICGLISVGVHVADLRVNPTTVSRYVLKNKGARGGIHARIDPRDPKSILIEFFDDRGININKTVERKLENIFFREDFRRTSMDEVGRIEFPSRIIDEYHEGFFKNLDEEIISRANFKVVLNYGFGIASLVLPHILGKMDCETVSINAYLDVQQACESMDRLPEDLATLKNIVTTLKSNIGVWFDKDCERIIVVDDKGEVIQGNRLLALFAHLLLKHSDHGIIVVPVNAPSIIEEIAHKHGGKIIHTKSDGRSLMHTASLGEQKIIFGGHSNGSFIFPEFHPSFDPMFAFAKLLEFMAKEDRKLSEIAKEVPEFHMAHSEVECTWQEKGKLMRLMIEVHEDKPMEVIEGLKIFFDQAWVLMLPDPTEPLFHLYSEANSDREALELIEEFRETINKLKDKPAEMVKSENIEREKVNEEAREAKKQVYLPPERAFHFWIPGKYLGIQARSYKEFVDNIHFIDPISLEFHMSKGDFANWFEYELDYPRLADKIRVLRSEEVKGEQLREDLIKILS